MAGPGWYPDPGGSDRFRYWDGTRWSQQTSPTPTAPPPGATSSPAREAHRGNRGAMAAVTGLLALVVVGAIVAFLVIHPLGGDGNQLTGPQPTPTVSAWNDGSTPPPPPSPSATDSRSAGPSADRPTPGTTTGAHPPPPGVVCPTGDPLARTAHPQDGRIHGGGLSFAAIPGWTDQGQALGLSYAYDVGDQTHMLTPNWFAMNAVALVKRQRGFTDPQEAATSLIQCIASSSFYNNMTRAVLQYSHPVTIDGHQGWAVKTEIFCDVQGYPRIKGDDVVVMVVDTGNSDGFGMYFGSATIDDAYTQSAMQATMQSMQVD